MKKLRGNYDGSITYNVGDVVKFTDNVVYHLQHPAPAGTPPVNTRYWSRVDQSLSEAVRMVLDGMDIVGDDIPELANNLTTTASGKGLDARQGKALKQLIDALTERVAALEPKPEEEVGES